MVATDCIAAAAQIYLTYLPGGASVCTLSKHGALEYFNQFIRFFAGLKLRGRDQRTDTDYAILPVAVDRIQLVQQIIMKHAGSFLLFCFVVNVFILGECSPCY